MKDREGSRRGIVGRGAAVNPKNRFEKIAEGRFPKLSSTAFRKRSGMQPPLFD